MDKCTLVSHHDLASKIQAELVFKYDLNPYLASEMAWDLVEALNLIDVDMDFIEKFLLQ